MRAVFWGRDHSVHRIVHRCPTFVACVRRHRVWREGGGSCRSKSAQSPFA